MHTPAPLTRRWLPAPTLRDRELHLATDGNERGLCGQQVMWVRPGHETTQRPHCADCERLSRR
jgi:hypothetical protein